MGDAEPYLVSPLLELFDEGGVLHCLAGLAGDVVDAGLVLLHASHIVLEASLLLTALGGVVAEQVGQLLSVLAVLVDAQLQVLAEVLQVEMRIWKDFMQQSVWNLSRSCEMLANTYICLTCK